MKINEVEQRVGISKKNIRFYESQGLLTPRRNSENGYRDYTPEDVALLQAVKLLRKLGVPLEEIRRMRTGELTVGDGMRRHLISLEREQQNVEQAARMCRELREQTCRIEDLDAPALLARMEELERGETTFPNKQLDDDRAQRRAAATVAAAAMTLIMAGSIALLVWVWLVSGEERPPLPLMAVLVAIPGAVILGTLLALWQRLREIGRGELDDAKEYYAGQVAGRLSLRRRDGGDPAGDLRVHAGGLVCAGRRGDERRHRCHPAYRRAAAGHGGRYRHRLVAAGEGTAERGRG